MSITLAESKKFVTDDLQIGVIDEFRKSNYLFENLIFDDVASPVGGGAGWTYSYTRLHTQPTAEFRTVNNEYDPSDVEVKRYSVDLAILGGSFTIDRVLAGFGGIQSQTKLQIEQKIKAASALFNDTVINGDVGVVANAFDGLDKALIGSDTEMTLNTPIDLSTSSAVTANYVEFLDILDEFLAGLDGKPSAIMGNTKLIAKIRACARRQGTYTLTLNQFGQNVESYNGIPLIDLGAKAGSNNPVVGIEDDGTTSLYAARFGLDGFHAVSIPGQSPVKIWLPDFTSAGAVKTGECEMVTAVALKASKAAGVLRDIKVQ